MKDSDFKHNFHTHTFRCKHARGDVVDYCDYALCQSASNPYPLYPWLPFWEIATEYDVQVIVSADAHRPEDLQGKTGEAFDIVEQFGLLHMDVEALGNRDIAWGRG